jgi:hypothetical protein
MLTILQWYVIQSLCIKRRILISCDGESMQEAENSTNHLVDLVDELVSSNADLRIRIDALTMDPASLAPASQLMATIQEDEMSQSKSSRPFEVDLQTSRVYQRVWPRDSIWTPTSSQRGSMELSTFSELTLSIQSICMEHYGRNGAGNMFSGDHVLDHCSLDRLESSVCI